MKPGRSRSRVVPFLLSLPFLLGSYCLDENAAGPGDDDECGDSNTDDCIIDISYRNLATEPVHLWRIGEIGPDNRVAPQSTREEFRALRTPHGTSLTLTFRAGRLGAEIVPPVNFTITPTVNSTVLVDFNANGTLEVRSRSGRL